MYELKSRPFLVVVDAASGTSTCIALIRSPCLLIVDETILFGPTVPLNVCSMHSIAKLVCLRYTPLKKVICGSPVRYTSCAP